ncbi:MAG: beta-ketoacyl synthase [Planctomycetes bacterium]|nr:beta-ketoacyl synthase [Planctomycetota bacterium]
MRRIGVFGWGVVAPRSKNIEAFARNLESSATWLTPFNGFGPDNFLVGVPDFDLADYADWINARFPPNRIQQLERKMGQPTHFAVGAFIQALSQNPGIEEVLQQLDTAAHIYIGTGLGDLPTIYETSLLIQDSTREWLRFWAEPERNRALRDYLSARERGGGGAAAARGGKVRGDGVPPAPESVPAAERQRAEDAWCAYWAERSSELAEYLTSLREIEAISVEGDVESAKSGVIRRKRGLNLELQARWGAPEPPWNRVSPNVLWNIHSAPASQVSMIGKITGMTFAPVGACSTFGFALKLAMNAIRAGDAKAVVVGATDPAPHPMTIAVFYAARVLAADGAVSKPLTGLRGTHVSGGATVWIVGDYEYMTKQGFKPLGLEPLAIGLSADAEHIITPSRKGPLAAIREAFAAAGVSPEKFATWDMHATATPGDFLEVETLRTVLPETVLVTARKGTFGHGMGVSGGFELLAQYLGYERGRIYPTTLGEDELNREIARVHTRFGYTRSEPVPKDGVAGKLCMGVGGLNACIISRPWK